MVKHRVYTMKFASAYPLYVQKAERKNRTKAEVDQVIPWLTGDGEDPAGVIDRVAATRREGSRR